MFPELHMYANLGDEGGGAANRPKLRARAQRLFSEMAAKGKVHRIIQIWKRKPSRLLDREAVQCGSRVPSQHYAGQTSVPIDRIRGSEGRMKDFDDAFYPLHDRMLNRWLDVASMRLAGEDLPPVELIDIDGAYFVRDGHHRISVAKALGEAYVDADVTAVTC